MGETVKYYSESFVKNLKLALGMTTEELSQREIEYNEEQRKANIRQAYRDACEEMDTAIWNMKYAKKKLKELENEN